MKKLLSLWFLVVVLLSIFLIEASGFDEKKPEMLFFNWEDCEHCESVKKEFLMIYH